LDFYSVTLLLAVVLALGAVGTVVWARLRGQPGSSRQASIVLIAAALASNALSVGIHRLLDRGPRSSTPLDWEDFWRQHPAFAVALGLTLIAMMLLPAGRKEP
jgi:hypothetical protein